MHFIGPDQFHGFEARLTSDIYPPADFSWVPSWGNEGERDTNDPSSVLESGPCRRSVQIDFDEEVTYRAKRFIYDVAGDCDDRPFFLQVSFTHPHEPYYCLRPFWQLYEDTEIPPPSVAGDDVRTQDAHTIRILRDFGMLGYDFREEDISRARRAYYGSVSYLDARIGELVSTLEHAGFADKTVVVFTADHGEYLGERGMWFKKHFHEPSLHVPLMIAAPWIRPQRIREFASLVDLLPTFNGLATGSVWEPVEALEGVDLCGFLDCPSGPPQRVVAAEYLAESALAPIFMLRKGPWKLITSSADPDLLYNLDQDPDELENLADRSEKTEVLASMRALAEQRWDSVSLHQDILLSQRRRRLIRMAHANGVSPRWNHGEQPGEQVRWYRGDEGYNRWAFRHFAGLRSAELNGRLPTSMRN